MAVTGDRPLSPLIIAVDGPAASGKSTIARELARRFELPFLDTGLLYRAVGRAVLLAGRDPGDAEAARSAAEALDARHVDESVLKGDEIGQAGSKVAAVPAVRAALLAVQRGFAANGAVLAGRDVGTVICPEAPAKLFVTASVEARAERRFQELLRNGANPILAKVLEDMIERDRRDTSRAVAPLRVAPDARLLDTTSLSLDAALAASVELVGAAIKAARDETGATGSSTDEGQP